MENKETADLSQVRGLKAVGALDQKKDSRGEREPEESPPLARSRVLRRLLMETRVLWGCQVVTSAKLVRAALSSLDYLCDVSANLKLF